jgi:aldehyde dehydrogenase (NAD+)
MNPTPSPALPAAARKRLFIDGAWVNALSGQTIDCRNPATGELIATIAAGDKDDIDRAVLAARRAFNGAWSRTKPYERQMILLRLADLVEKHYDELALTDTIDMGAPISRTLGSRHRALGMLRFYAGQATTLQGETIENSFPGDYFTYTLKEPVGVVGAIIPWNSPLTASIWKLGPVLATGCTIVLKPAEDASLTVLRIAELCEEAGVPKGVVNIVTGYGHSAGDALARHPGVDKVAFTGSQDTARKVITASAVNFKRVSLELGGKSPDVVFADADLDAAVPGTAMAVFGNSGQVCSAGTRLFVQDKIYEEFTARLAAFSKSLKIGDGRDPATQIGPLISQNQYKRVAAYLDIGRDEGAKLLAGGYRLDGAPYDNGHFVSPTVFSDVTDSMRIATEEIFGPVICVIPFKSMDEVVERSNATDFGLGSGVWTRDVAKAHRFAKEVRAGSVWVNCYNPMDPAVPFGGYKSSGYGRESGIQHVQEYLNVKAVWINKAGADA